MGVSDARALLPSPPHRGDDRAVGRAPPHDEELRVPVGIVDLELGDVRGDARDLLRPQPHHQVVVVRVVRDVAGDVGLLEPADPVLEPGVPGIAHGRASVSGSRRYGWNGSSPASAKVVEMSGRSATSGISHGSEPLARYASERRYTGVRYLSAMRTASIAASKHCDGLEAATTGTALAVPAEQDHQEIGLLGLRRHPRRRPRPLDVEDQERQLERDREADGLGLQHDRAGRGGDAERAAEGRADRGADCRDLVLGLERDDAELLAPRELLEDRRRRSDGVRAEEERQAGELRRGDRSRAPCCP